MQMKKNILIWFGGMMVFTLMLTSCSLLNTGTGTSTNAITIKSVTFAESINSSHQAVNPKAQFKPTDTIYASVDVSGRPTTGLLNGKFYYGDQFLSEATLDFAVADSSVLFSLGTETYTNFNLAPSNPWPVGSGYHLDLYINGVKANSYPYEVIQ
jgi:hypothetical protein